MESEPLLKSNFLLMGPKSEGLRKAAERLTGSCAQNLTRRPNWI